jgi:hypothetical protein
VKKLKTAKIRLRKLLIANGRILCFGLSANFFTASQSSVVGRAVPCPPHDGNQALFLCPPCPAIRQHHAHPARFQVRHFMGKIQCQGNVCQGNGKKRFLDYSPDNHSPGISPAFAIPHPPSSLWLRLAAPGSLRLLPLPFPGSPGEKPDGWPGQNLPG